MTVKYKSDLSHRVIMQGDKCIKGYHDRDTPDIVVVENVSDAASVFAHRAARRAYGNRGYCHHTRLDLRKESGDWFLYEAFIGVPAHGGSTNGKNIRFTVSVEERP